MLNFGKKARYVLLGSFLTMLCSQGSHATSVDDVTKIIEQAVHSQSQARSEGYGWTITATYIDQAKSKLAAGQTDSAMATAQRALLVANKSLDQARAEKTAWQARVPTL
ncbi:MAG: hypothetical protein V7696_18120 [Halioglobus sp.]